jgi:formate hydrogenlyase subunit 3/multisubunit Na+/H+ antiporter MnhD subunit
VSPLLFVIVAFAAAVACLATAGRPAMAIPIGIGGLGLASVTAALIEPGVAVHLAGSDLLVGTAYARLFILIASLGGLLTCLVSLATSWPAGWVVRLPAAALAGLGGIALALSAPDPLLALVILLGISVAIAPVALGGPVSLRDIGTVAGNVRVLALAGALAISAVAWASPTTQAGPDSAAFGLADLAIVLAVALRFGVVPFHRPVARLSSAAPGPAIPLLLVWGPAGLAVIAIGTTDGSLNALLVPGGVGQALIVALAAATLGLGAIAAWLQDDLEHVVGYSIVQDAGFVLLGLAVAGPDAGAAARTWLLILVAVKTAFAAWAAVTRSRFGSGRLPELSGWIRRSPLMAAGLIGIALATIGLPGLVAWQVRWTLVDGASDGLLSVVLLLGGLASLAYYGRILWIGTGRLSPRVADSIGDRPVGSPRGQSLAETLDRGAAANRGQIATGLVLGLVLLSVLVAAGGLGGPDAARAAGASAAPPASPTVGPAAGPSGGPLAGPSGGPPGEPSP